MLDEILKIIGLIVFAFAGAVCFGLMVVGAVTILAHGKEPKA